jgi:UDP-glucose:(heptosyl)LPS alpha-1,3-glucosyltransferase
MRIGLVIDHFDPRRGGAQQWTYQHAERLLARGHDVHVVARTISDAARQLPVVPHPLGRIRSILAQAQAAEDTLRGLRLDVVHDMGLGWHNDVLQSEDGSRLAQWEQMLLVLPPVLRPLKRGLIALLPRYAAARRLMERQFGDPRRTVVAISKMCGGDYQHYHGVPPERIRLVYHGTDTDRFSPTACARRREAARHERGIGDEEVVFLFVGHDFRRKGLGTAVRAVLRLANQGLAARLLVVGGNRRSRRFQWLLVPRHPAITLLGPVADPLPCYAAADALVLPSFYDPFGLVVLEAAACGLPVAVSRFTGAAELLTEGVEGFVLDDPADDRELADKLRCLMAPVPRLSMGEAARRLALRHTLDRNCDELLAVYDEVAGSLRRAA